MDLPVVTFVAGSAGGYWFLMEPVGSVSECLSEKLVDEEETSVVR